MNTHETCEICSRIDLIKKRENPFFVKEMETGYVVIGDHQLFRGYTLFLSKIHVVNLLELEDRGEHFFNDARRVALAASRAFKPERVNIELLGNTDHHLHWHIFPRYKNDPVPTKPVWSLNKTIRCNESTKAKPEEIKMLRELLLKQL